jgi:hypothetical protein
MKLRMPAGGEKQKIGPSQKSLQVNRIENSIVTMQYNIVVNWLNSSRLATGIYRLEANGITTKKHTVGPKAAKARGLGTESPNIREPICMRSRKTKFFLALSY